MVQIQRNFGVGNKEEAADAEKVEDKDPDMTETPDAPLSEDTVEEGTADEVKNNQGVSIVRLDPLQDCLFAWYIHIEHS